MVEDNETTRQRELGKYSVAVISFFHKLTVIVKRQRKPLGLKKRRSEWYFRFNFNLGPVNIELGDPGRWRHPTFDVNVIKLK